MNILTRIIVPIILFIPIVVFGWLLQQQFVPGGVFVVTHSVEESSSVIDGLLPQARVNEPFLQDGEWVQEIVGDPAFFFLHPQRNFNRVSFEVWFQNDQVPIVELGGLAQTAPEIYDLKPLHNLIIEQSSWNRIDDNGVVLLQRHKTYDSINAFIENPPARESVAVYHTDFLSTFRLDGYRPSIDSRTINVSLRGHHEFKTYIKDEQLNVTFEYMDMNRDEGADQIVVTVFNEKGQPVADARAADDGDSSKLARPSPMKSIHLSLDELEEGVYKLIFSAPRDIFIRNIKTTQSKLVVVNAVYLGDEVAYKEPVDEVTFYTNAKRIRAQTRHAEGLQTITFGETSFVIDEPYRSFTFKTDERGLLRVHVRKGDVEFFVDGPLAFSLDAYFNPDPNKLQYYSDLDAQKIDYVIAEYRSPVQRGDWLVAEVGFDLDVLRFETDEPGMRFFRDGAFKFAFSTAGIEETNSRILVKEINLTLKGELVKLRDFFEFLFE